MPPARTDANQKEIVQALERTGCVVQDLSAVGQGCPDLLVSKLGVNILLEVKMPKGKLNSRQEKWHKEWKGQVTVVTSVEEALAAIDRLTDTPVERYRKAQQLRLPWDE